MNPNNIYSIFEYLLELSQVSARELINLYHSKNQTRTTLLKIPEKPNGSLRISEQEFRFAMTCLHGTIFHPDLIFSVENPTERTDYSFSGGKPQNAWTDLSFFYKDTLKPILNIEFKADNVGLPFIIKDIEKLCKEPALGGWCHIFKELAPTYPQTTMKSLLKKFGEAISEHFQPRVTQPISFHILILKDRTLLSRKGNPNDWVRFEKIHKQGDDEISKKWLKQKIFNIEYDDWKNLKPGKHQFWRGQLIDSTNPNHDWQVDKY